MSYDPKAKRPAARPDEDDDPAPVDQLLGAPPRVVPEPPGTPAADTEPESANDARSDDGHLTFDPRPETPPAPSFPEPDVTTRTPKAIAAAVVALIVLFIGWRRRHR